MAKGDWGMEWVAIEGLVEKTTEKAVLFRCKTLNGNVSKWFPRSVIDEGEVIDGGFDEIFVRQYFVEQLDLELP